MLSRPINRRNGPPTCQPDGPLNGYLHVQTYGHDRFNGLLFSTVSHDEGISRASVSFRLSATQESSAICSTAFLVGQIFSLSWQELPVPRPERYATSHPKKNKRMVRFVL